MNQYLNFLFFSWKPVLEIAILWFVIYHILLFFEGTRAFQVLRGILILLAAFFFFHKLNLSVLEWLLTKIFAISVIAILVIFHPEIRQGLARLGQRNLFNAPLIGEELDVVLAEIAGAAESLAKQKIGAIIAIEKNDKLSSYMESGVLVGARVSSELLEAIFTPHNPLHDGGVIIQNGVIQAAGCLFPLTENLQLSRIFGTRHRAALGLSETTDAVILIVSEERQDISLVHNGRFNKDLNQKDLVLLLRQALTEEKPHG